MVPVDPVTRHADVVGAPAPRQVDLGAVRRGRREARGRGGRFDVLAAARARATVGERAPWRREELPVVARRVQDQLQHAEAGVLEHLRVRLQRAEDLEVAAAGSHDELTDASDVVGRAVWCLRREALVVVGVPRQHDVGVRVVQRLPQRLEGGAGRVAPTRREPRLVPVGEGASGGMRGQVRPEPGLLGRARLAPAHGAALGVQRDHVPGPGVERVVALRRVTRPGAEVGEVPARTRRVVFVVSRHRERAVEQATPRRAVDLLELAERAGLVLIVAEGQHRVGVHAEQEVGGGHPLTLRGRRAVRRRAGDVACHADDGIGRRRGRHLAEVAVRRLGRGALERRAGEREPAHDRADGDRASAPARRCASPHQDPPCPLTPSAANTTLCVRAWSQAEWPRRHP